MYLEDVLDILLEEQIIHVTNEDGDDLFHGYRGNLNEEIPFPKVKATGIFASWDKKEERDDLEIVVKEKKRRRAHDD